MEFQITMDPFMDFIFRMFIIGANIVVWTMIAVWLQVEIKSWFPKKEEEPLEFESMREYSEKDAGLTMNIFNNGEPDLTLYRKSAVPHYTILDDGQLVQNVDIPVEPTSTTTYIENEETTDEVNRRRH